MDELLIADAAEEECTEHVVMGDFQQKSKAFLKDVSKAAAWMMKRNVGETHWWRWSVLTAKNPDKSKRPIFDDDTAQKIFEKLKKRNLLIEFTANVDASGVPAYAMQYDIEGWDKALSDGRPVYGMWIKLKRNWLLSLLTFILGCLLTAFENRTVGLIDKGMDAVIGHGKNAN
jgi:hypothetical protein